MILKQKQNSFYVRAIIASLALLAVVVFVFALSNTSAQAAFITCGNANGGDISSYDCSLKAFFIAVIGIINYLVKGAGVVAVLGVIYGAFKMVTSQGNPTALGAAKKTITYSIVGLVIVLVSVLLIQTTVRFLGFKGGEGVITNPTQSIQ